MPQRRCKKFSATRSAFRIERASPRTSIITSPGGNFGSVPANNLGRRLTGRLCRKTRPSAPEPATIAFSRAMMRPWRANSPAQKFGRDISCANIFFERGGNWDRNGFRLHGLGCFERFINPSPTRAGFQIGVEPPRVNARLRAVSSAVDLVKRTSSIFLIMDDCSRDRQRFGSLARAKKIRAAHAGRNN